MQINHLLNNKFEDFRGQPSEFLAEEVRLNYASNNGSKAISSMLYISITFT